MNFGFFLVLLSLPLFANIRFLITGRLNKKSVGTVFIFSLFTYFMADILNNVKNYLYYGNLNHSNLWLLERSENIIELLMNLRDLLISHAIPEFILFTFYAAMLYGFAKNNRRFKNSMSILILIIGVLLWFTQLDFGRPKPPLAEQLFPYYSTVLIYVLMIWIVSIREKEFGAVVEDDNILDV